MALKPNLDVSSITDFLYISSWPRGHHTEEIRAMNVGLILSMHWIKPFPMLEPSPVPLLWLPTVDTPYTPMPMFVFNRGVKAALPVIHKGYSVLVHCKAGVHRSVAMTCCVLIGLGYTADEAMELVQQKRAVASPRTWYIERRIYKFEQQWRARNAGHAANLS